MAIVAHIVCTETAEEGYAAAEHTLPINLFRSVLFTLGHASSSLLQKTTLAQKVLFSGFLLLSVSHLLFAVY